MGETKGRYPAARRVTIAETPGLRVRELTLAEGQCVPWHYHSNITDTFFCMEGPMQVTTRNPDQAHVLQPGGTFAVAPGVPHLVAGVDDGPCRFIVVQGVGVYDFVPVAGEKVQEPGADFFGFQNAAPVRMVRNFESLS